MRFVRFFIIAFALHQGASFAGTLTGCVAKVFGEDLPPLSEQLNTLWLQAREISTKGKSTREAVLEIVSKSQQLLQENGVQFKMRGDSEIIILPQGDHPLNRYAASLLRDKLVDIVVFDPAALLKRNMVGAFQPGSPSELRVPLITISSLKPSAPFSNTIAHETMHARHFREAKEGLLTPYNSHYRSDSKGLGFRGYMSYFVVGELATHQLDRNALVLYARAAWKNGNYTQAATLIDDSAFKNEILQGFLRGINYHNNQLSEVLQALKANPKFKITAFFGKTRVDIPKNDITKVSIKTFGNPLSIDVEMTSISKEVIGITIPTGVKKFASVNQKWVFKQIENYVEAVNSIKASKVYNTDKAEPILNRLNLALSKVDPSGPSRDEISAIDEDFEQLASLIHEQKAGGP